MPSVHPQARAAFDALDRAGVPWLLLRGRRSLARPDRDIDVLVSRDWRAIAQESLAQSGLVRVLAHGHGSHRFHFAFGQDGWTGLDVVDELAFGRYQDLVSPWAPQVLARGVVREGIPSPDPSDEALLLLLHLVLDKGGVPAHRRAEALAALRHRPLDSPLAARLDAIAGEGCAYRLTRVLGDEDASARLSRLLAARWRRSVPGPAVTRAVTARLGRRIPVRVPGRPRGVAIGVLGPDGAGKTTLLDGLAASLPLTTHYRHLGLWKPHAWDALLERVPGARLGLALTRVSATALSVAVHRLRGEVVLLDRLALDTRLSSDDSSVGGRITRWVAHAVAPPVDLILVLDAPGSVMYQRKREHSPQILEEWRQEYRRIAEEHPRAHLLDATATPGQTLASATRIVWRTLVGDPPGPLHGRQAVDAVMLGDGPWLQPGAQVGIGSVPLPAGWVRGLQEAGAQVRPLAGAPTATLHLVVTHNPHRRELSHAARALTPDGAMLTLGSGLPGLGVLPRLRSRIRAAGWTVSGVTWHAPSLHRSARLVPLDSAPALDSTLRRVAGIPAGALVGVAARGTARLGAMPVLVAQGSLWSARGGIPRTWLAGLLADPRAADRIDAAQAAGAVVITPRYETSRHLIALLHHGRGARPSLAVKVPRDPGDTAGIDRESRVLTHLGDQGFSGVPELLGVWAHRGRPAMVTTALAGEELSPQRVRADPVGARGAVLAFVARLGRLPAPPVEPAAALRGLVDLAARCGQPSWLTALTAATHAAMRPELLTGAVEHGDLGHPNLLVEPASGRLTVLDWERADLTGIAGSDLVYAWHYLTCALEGAWRTQDQVALLRREFSPSGAGLSALRGHLTSCGADPRRAEEVVMLTWARCAASLAERLPARGAEAAVAVDRDVALWRASVVLMTGTDLDPAQDNAAR
ncbi:phosphotransferase [Serinibacter salmoneus]|uniref:Thymidylate kinase n=1 Tax=Serinibacter salmoneus TaxID=556530 RepID=A0A2A9CYL5_9MICO|nr:phosphotransferase [Serinibacter salmoneus]PFG19538.1 thymidylate kinase [Serinibacter salmoneus]